MLKIARPQSSVVRPSSLHPAGEQERGRDQPDQTEHCQQSALGEDIQQRVVGLEVRRAVRLGMSDIFWFARRILAAFENQGRYRKVRTRPESQHSRFNATIDGVLPGLKSDLSGLFSVALVALRQVVGQSAGFDREGIAERNRGSKNQGQRENRNPYECRADGEAWLTGAKPCSQFERNEDRARGHEDKAECIAFAQPPNVNRKNGSSDGGDPRGSAGCDAGKVQG